MWAMRRVGIIEGALKKKVIRRTMPTLMKQELKLEPSVRGRKEHRVEATRVTQISGENFEENPLDHSQPLGNEKEKRKVSFLLIGLEKNNFSR